MVSAGLPTLTPRRLHPVTVLRLLRSPHWGGPPQQCFVWELERSDTCPVDSARPAIQLVELGLHARPLRLCRAWRVCSTFGPCRSSFRPRSRVPR